MSETTAEEKQGFENPNSDEPVWTYRGYSIKASEFVTAMVHFFRAEISRANIWRQRLDTTTNWAVISTGAVLSIAFSQPNSHHGVIILSTLLVTWFLYMESRRYRYYELWSSRIRLMETDFYAAMLVPPFHPSPDWAETLSENLLQPRFPISIWEAFGRRLRRNYLWLFIILGASWFAKLWLYPVPASSILELLGRGAIGPLQGWIVLSFGIGYYAFLFFTSLFTIGMHQASGEVFPRFGPDDIPVPKLNPQAWFRPHRRRQQLLAFIVSEKGCAKDIAEGIMEHMNRGVTALQGTGMFTGEDRAILMCAITVTEVNNLKSITAKIEPDAFVITTNANEVFGRGFVPLGDK